MTVPSRITIPFDRIGLSAADVLNKAISGTGKFAVAGYGDQVFLDDPANSVTLINNPADIDQFTISLTNTEVSTPTFVANITETEYDLLLQGDVAPSWAYANTVNANGGIVIASGDIVRDSLLLETQQDELLFSSETNYISTETTQQLRPGRRFDRTDAIVILYHLTNPNAPKSDWTQVFYPVAPLISGGFNNNAIQSLSDTQFRLTTGGSAIFSVSAITADPPTQAFEIWAL